jgi:hypothetical protein
LYIAYEIVLIAKNENENGLQDLLSMSNKWCKGNGTGINVSKGKLYTLDQIQFQGHVCFNCRNCKIEYATLDI